MKTRVGVFFGGASVEHEVAVISAVQAMHNMDKNRYDIIPVYVTKKGELYYGERLMDIEAYRNLPSLLSECLSVSLVKQDEKFNLVELKKGLFKKVICSIDIAFPIVHGTNCEDGSVAGWFEMIGIPYVGCDVVSSAVGMDKAIFKNVMDSAGVPVLPCMSFYAKKWTADMHNIIKRIESKFLYPLIVKPANLGSSVGISKANNIDELKDSVSLAMSFASKILVEPAVNKLRELNCSVLGDVDDCESSVVEEPIMSDEILSFNDKYIRGSKGMSSAKRKIPADISDEKAQEIMNYAKKAFTALGCSGVSRIDFLMDIADNDRVYVNEINTIPGSLSFYLWEPKGISYKDLLDKMISLGFKRARTRQNLMFTYDTNILSSGNAFGTKGIKK